MKQVIDILETLPCQKDRTIVVINDGWVQIWLDGEIAEQQFFATAKEVAEYGMDIALRLGVRPLHDLSHFVKRERKITSA